MIERLPEQVMESLELGLYHLAFYVALTMPDIAGAIDEGSRAQNGKRYRNWFDKYAKSNFESGFGNSFLTSDECWKLRCSILHEGITDYELVAASSDELLVSTGVYSRKDESTILDVHQFCHHMVNAFYSWIEAKEKDSSFQFRNLEINDISKVVWRIR